MDKITFYLITMTGVAWLLWDLYVYAYGEETISEKLHRWSKDITVTIPHSFGFLCGHWFLKQPGDFKLSTGIICVITAVLLTIDLVKYVKNGRGYSPKVYPRIAMSTIFSLGLINGYLFF
jgi:hypothetical protein